MSASKFERRREDFGFSTAEPWSLNALRLLYHSPRVFRPLAEAWEQMHPGTLSGLERLTELGFVAYQGPVVVDTRTQDQTDTATRAVDRFRLTASGHRLLKAALLDPSELRVRFPRITDPNIHGVIEMLSEFAVDSTRARDGRSLVHFATTGPLPRRTAYFWGEKLVAAGYLRQLPNRAPDARDAIPGHWRVTRALSTQLKTVFSEFTKNGPLVKEFRLGRTRYLDDIELTRVSVGGGTDFDHDVVAQALLAEMLGSPQLEPGLGVKLEPHFKVGIDNKQMPWVFNKGTSDVVFYQPDALFYTQSNTYGREVCALEYERLQSRRKAWSHIERFIGHLVTHSLPIFDPGARLLFVVDTERREKSYVELIEAFGDWAERNPDLMPAHKLTLSVSSRVRLDDAKDPLSRSAWFNVDYQTIPQGPGTNCVLHSADHSPYLEYFEADS